MIATITKKAIFWARNSSPAGEDVWEVLGVDPLISVCQRVQRV
jgi:hypothetical protein